jgi:hypothetical protein
MAVAVAVSVATLLVFQFPVPVELLPLFTLLWFFSLFGDPVIHEILK